MARIPAGWWSRVGYIAAYIPLEHQNPGTDPLSKGNLPISGPGVTTTLFNPYRVRVYGSDMEPYTVPLEPFWPRRVARSSDRACGVVAPGSLNNP